MHAIFERILKQPRDEAPGHETPRDEARDRVWYYGACVALLPFVVLLYQYTKNIEYLLLSQVLILCCLVATIFVAFFLILYQVSRNPLSAFWTTALVFFSYFMYRSLLGIIERTVLFTNLSLDWFLGFAQGLFLVVCLGVWRMLSARFDLHNKDDEGVSTHRKHQVRRVIVGMLPLVAIGVVVYANTRNPIQPLGTLLLLLTATLILVSLILINRFASKLSSALVPQIILILLAVLIVQSAVGIGAFLIQQEGNSTSFKETFYVSEDKVARPNVYWFHLDGMLGFDSMVRFFGDEQTEFLAELEGRGFVVSREAAMDAQHSSQFAIPALMSPFYYDRVMSWRFDPTYAESLAMNADLIAQPHLRIPPNFTSNRTAREKNELVAAFNAAGYNTSSIGTIGFYFFPTVNQFYHVNDDEASILTTARAIPQTVTYINRISALQNLVELLNMISPTPGLKSDWVKQSFKALNRRGFEAAPITYSVDLFAERPIDAESRSKLEVWNRKADALIDTLARPAPRFTLVNFPLTHRPFFFDEQGHYDEDDADNPSRYLAHHRFSAWLLLEYLDIILAHDPDAVIVLQADHGLHGLSIEEIVAHFGCSEEEALALWHQVMSAVRIPDQERSVQNIEILSDPRNIARFLVNTYVGENYDYIPVRYRQSFVGPDR